MTTKRTILLGLLLLMPHFSIHAEYLHGILPTNADIATVKEYWEAYKASEVNDMGDRAVAGDWEYHAMAMVFAAYLEDDEALFAKLWKEVERDLDWNRSLWTKYPAADVLIDIAMGLDRAALRWGGKWPELAERWIKQFEFKLGVLNKRCGCWQDPSGEIKDPLHCGAIAGDRCGHYINYYAFSHFFRFDQRTNQTLWMDSVMSACWFTMEHTYEINALPPWYVQMKDIDNDGIAEGVQRLPGDMNNSKTGDKWDGGATRAAWRIPFAYIAFGDPWALKWTQKMYDFYKSKQSDPTLLSAYRPSSGEQYYEGPSDLSIYGAGVIAMALGDHEWTDKVWDYMTDPARKSERNDQKKAQRLYCLLQMSGEFDVYGDAEFAPAVSVESKPHAQSLRSPEKIQGMIIGKNAIIPHHIRDYVKDHGAVAVYDLRGTLVGSADDHTSLVGLASGLSAGKYLLRPSAATLHR